MDIDNPLVTQAIEAARAARARAYAPYSRFKMGAAIVTDSGEVVGGTLIENVSLGLAMCAERVALFNAVSSGAGKPKALVLCAPTTDHTITWPCGACLQVARELAASDLLIVATDGDTVEAARLADLAPRLPVKAV